MLTELALRNFKAFGDEVQAIPLSKINLIYGPNSSGKSTIIQSLLLLKQSQIVHRRELSRRGAFRDDIRHLTTTGEYIDLGSLSSILHKHEIDRELGINTSFSFLDTRNAKVQTTFADSRMTEPLGVSPSSILSNVKYQTFKDGEMMFDAAMIYDVHEDTWQTELNLWTTDEVRDDIYFVKTFFLPPFVIDKKVPFEAQLTQIWFEDHINALTYLGPLMSYPERLYTVSPGFRHSTGIRGEYTPHILYYHDEVIERVNEWFCRLQIPYTVKAIPLGEVELIGERIAITLIDKLSGTPVTLPDVGFGINQLLPIIIEGVSSGRLTRGCPIICVEQPEIHLHPRLQAEIAELMIDTACGENHKQWIVETHSEMLIRRVQRRIKEKKLDPSDVSVIYVDPDEDGDGSIIEILELDERGKFIDEWPNGFFDEGIKELLGF